MSNKTYEEVIENVKKYGYKPPTHDELNKFDLSGHYALWDWFVKHPLRSKYDWPHITKELEEQNCCYACMYAVSNHGLCLCKHHCPLDWPNNKTCQDKEGLYSDWAIARGEYRQRANVNTKNEIIELAKKIRDLKVKEGIDFR